MPDADPSTKATPVVGGNRHAAWDLSVLELTGVLASGSRTCSHSMLPVMLPPATRGVAFFLRMLHLRLGQCEFPGICEWLVVNNFVSGMMPACNNATVDTQRSPAVPVLSVFGRDDDQSPVVTRCSGIQA